jgi:hypothetical protein
MSGTNFLHFSGRLGLHEADLHGVYLNGSIRVVTADIMIRRPFPLWARPAYLMPTGFHSSCSTSSAFFPRIWRSQLMPFLLSSFVAPYFFEKHKLGALQQFGTSTSSNEYFHGGVAIFWGFLAKT